MAKKQVPEKPQIQPAEKKRQDTLLNGDAGVSTEPKSLVGQDADLKTLGRYQVLGELGRGGMGAVYLADDTKLKRQVALKIPQFEASKAEQMRARFEREAQMAAQLSHPNICQVYDVAEIDGRLVMSMEYIPGKTMAAYTKTGKLLSDRQAVTQIRKVALAVEAAHQKGMIHRDLKPGNIMLCRPDPTRKTIEPKVMDFGLAKSFEANATEFTKSGMIVGTPCYMSKEQWSARDVKLGPQCDVYSLGIILYELLTGKLPFDVHPEEPPTAWFVKLVTESPIKVSDRKPDIDAALEVIVMKAIAVEPINRYASMAAFGVALEDWLKGKTVSGQTQLGEEIGELNLNVKPVTRSFGRGKKPPKSRLAIAGYGGAAALVLLGIILTIRKPDGSTQKVTTSGDTVTITTDHGDVISVSADENNPAPNQSDNATGDDAAWTPLFDGRTLTGWHGDPTLWTVSLKDGAIVGTSDGTLTHNSCLVCDRPYSDFVLKLKFKLHEHQGNSGVQFRSEEVTPDAAIQKYTVHGYQADIIDVIEKMGQLYDEGGGRKTIAAAPSSTRTRLAQSLNVDGWNELVIEANGRHVRQTINGIPTVDIEDPSGPESGVIALQLHQGKPMKVSFKDIVISPLAGKNKVVNLNESSTPPVHYGDRESLRRGTGNVDKDASNSFTSTPSGLKYRILRSTNGTKPLASDAVTVRYRGWFDDGQVFDSTYDSKPDNRFHLSEVNRGWREGLQLIGVGGMIELWIPPYLGYGSRGAPPAIPPNATLHFVIELTDVASNRAVTDGVAEWTSLFDGTDAGAWQSLGPFSVTNGLLVANQGGGGMAISKQQFSDFELEAEWQIKGATNSGIYYREGATVRSIPVGTEYQIANNQTGAKDQTAGLYGMVAPVTAITPIDGEWYTTRIVCTGTRVEHWLNDQLMLTYDTGAEDWKKVVADSSIRAGDEVKEIVGARQRGHIWLQRMTGDIAFRHIRIRELSSIKGTNVNVPKSSSVLPIAGSTWSGTYKVTNPDTPVEQSATAVVSHADSGGFAVRVTGQKGIWDYECSPEDDHFRIAKATLIQVDSTVPTGEALIDSSKVTCDGKTLKIIYSRPVSNGTRLVTYELTLNDSVGPPLISTTGDTVVPSASGDVVFQKGSIWSGENEAGKLRLTVIDRNADSFVARFEVGSTIVRRVSGIVKDGKLNWRANDVVAEKGKVGGDNSGIFSMDGNVHKIDFEWDDSNRNGNFSLQLETMTFAIALKSSRPDDAVSYRGNFYKAFSDELTWHEAKAECERLGGHLVVVTNAAENEFVFQLAAKAGLSETWLGATDEQVEGKWVWADSKPMNFSAWGNLQPNAKGDGEDFVILVIDLPKPVGFNGKWCDQPSRAEALHHPGFICEWER